jgi:N-acetylmuramoyl-L-alanine amidase
MHKRISLKTSFLYILLFCSRTFYADAQHQGASYETGDITLKSVVISSKDSAAAGNEKTSLTPGAGSVLAKYNKANQLYLKMIDSLTKVLYRYPLIDTSSGLKYAAEWVGTPNMGLRRPNFVIIHYTANNSCEETLREFTTVGGREASAHYVICKDGTIHHMLNDLLRSHHAGESKWGNNTDLNSSSIGIELVNNGTEAYPEAQINSLLVLLERLKTSYKIPVPNFIGHADVAPARKTDPGAKFPWKALSENGFGLWWDDTTGVQVPDQFDYLMGLRIIGYDISNPDAAVAAFKKHFMGDNSRSMNSQVRKIIYTLYRKFE